MVHLFYALPVLLLLPTHVPSLPMPQSYSLENEYPDIEPKYRYQYAVTDDYTKSNFQAQEERDGFSTLGSYRVALPDGRIQIVTYSANKDGYVAEVTYEGEAVYPEDFESPGVYTGSPSVHSNTVYKADRTKKQKEPFKQSSSSVYNPSTSSQYKPAPIRPQVKKQPPKKVQAVKPRPVKIPYNEDPPQFYPSYKPIPSPAPNVASYKPEPKPYNSQPASYDRVRFEEILKEEPTSVPAPQSYRPEPRRPAPLLLDPELRIETDGVVLEEASLPSLVGGKASTDQTKAFEDKDVISEEYIEEEQRTRVQDDFEVQEVEDEELVQVDENLGDVEIIDEAEVVQVPDDVELVVIDDREEIDDEVLKPQIIKDAVVETEASKPFEEVETSDKRVEAENKTEETLDITKSTDRQAEVEE